MAEKWTWDNRGIGRKVVTQWFGFTRETWEKMRRPSGGWPQDIPRFLRALNEEPEPEVKLSDGGRVSPYRFSTDALKAELARREKEDGPTVTGSTSWTINGVNGTVVLIEPVHFPIHTLERRKADRRKPKGPVKRKKR